MGELTMESTKIRKAVIGCLISCLFLFAAVMAQQKTEELKATSKMLDVKTLPPAVQKTVQEQTKGATIRGLSKEVENGKTQYELETKANGHNRDLLIDPEGKVLEVEEEVDIASLPATVQTEIKKNLGTGKILRLESVSKNNSLTGYEASVERNGKQSSLAMGPDGKALPKRRK